MVWPFARRRGSSVQPLPTILHFKSGAAAFEYQCKYGFTEIKENVAVAALVLDAKQLFGWDEPVGLKKDGAQFMILRVASRDGGFEVFSQTPSKYGEPLAPDDLVRWVPAAYCDEAANAFADRRSSWTGFIRAKILPQLDMANPEWAIVCRYDFS